MFSILWFLDMTALVSCIMTALVSCILSCSFLSALKMAAGGGLGGGGGNPIWSLVWFLALLFAAFPVAGFCAGWYILILPFSVCVDGLTVGECKRGNKYKA